MGLVFTSTACMHSRQNGILECPKGDTTFTYVENDTVDIVLLNHDYTLHDGPALCAGCIYDDWIWTSTFGVDFINGDVRTSLESIQLVYTILIGLDYSHLSREEYYTRMKSMTKLKAKANTILKNNPVILVADEDLASRVHRDESVRIMKTSYTKYHALSVIRLKVSYYEYKNRYVRLPNYFLKNRGDGVISENCVTMRVITDLETIE